jgi:hypothetical protein
MRGLRSKLAYANVTATIAVFLGSAGGNAFAAEPVESTLPPKAHTLRVERSSLSEYRYGVILLGLVVTHGNPSGFRFEWGRTKAYGHRVGEGEEGDAYNAGLPVEVEEFTRRLRPNTTYHFRLVA